MPVTLPPTVMFSGIVHVRGTKEKMEERLEAHQAGEDKTLKLTASHSERKTDAFTSILRGRDGRVLDESSETEVLRDVAEGILLYDNDVIEFARRKYGIDIPPLPKKVETPDPEVIAALAPELEAYAETDFSSEEASIDAMIAIMKKGVPQLTEQWEKFGELWKLTLHDHDQYVQHVFDYYQERTKGPLGRLKSALGRLKLGPIRVERYPTVEKAAMDTGV